MSNERPARVLMTLNVESEMPPNPRSYRSWLAPSLQPELALVLSAVGAENAPCTGYLPEATVEVIQSEPPYFASTLTF